jgi:hypothetical protein
MASEHYYLKHRTVMGLFGLVVLLIGAMPDATWAQYNSFQRHSTHKRNSPQQNVTLVPAVQTTPAASSVLDTTSPLGQALAACDKGAAVQDVFALPGLKGDVTLDRCYKGRAHLICVSTVLITEAKSLAQSYVRIVEAKYPDLDSIEAICGLKVDALGSDINGSQEFIKRFSMLKSQYDTASNCVTNVDQSFKEVVLTEMAQPPELLKSITDTIETNFNKVTEVQNQVADLATQIEASKKAMITLDKIRRAMCVKEERTAEQSSN